MAASAYRPVSIAVERLEKYTLGGYHPVDLGHVLSEEGRWDSSGSEADETPALTPAASAVNGGSNGGGGGDDEDNDGESEGECLRRYKIIHKLGFGGFSTVWLARALHRPGHHYVALKIWTAGLSAVGERELDPTPGLPRDLPFIVRPRRRFFIEGPNGRHLCQVLPVLGPSLAQLSHQAYRLRPAACRALCRQAAEILAVFHHHGLVHGDGLSEDELLQLIGEPRTEEVIRYGSGTSASSGSGTLPSLDLVLPGPPFAPRQVVEPANLVRLGTQFLQSGEGEGGSCTLCLADFDQVFSFAPPTAPPSNTASPVMSPVASSASLRKLLSPVASSSSLSKLRHGLLHNKLWNHNKHPHDDHHHHHHHQSGDDNTDDTQQPPTANPGYRLATPLVYRAPEVFLDGAAGPAADVWALACTVFRLRAGAELLGDVPRWAWEDSAAGRHQSWAAVPVLDAVFATVGRQALPTRWRAVSFRENGWPAGSPQAEEAMSRRQRNGRAQGGVGGSISSGKSSSGGESMVEDGDFVKDFTEEQEKERLKDGSRHEDLRSKVYGILDEPARSGEDEEPQQQEEEAEGEGYSYGPPDIVWAVPAGADECTFPCMPLQEAADMLDLLRRMLRYETAERITIGEVLEQPWLNANYS